MNSAASDPHTPGIPQHSPPETIELLSVDLLEQNRAVVQDLKRLAAALRLEFGWHYLLDLAWILQRLGPIAQRRILDAGAGTGILQWYLAEKGAEVVSVDRMSRANLPLRLRRRFNAQGLRPQDLLPPAQAFLHNFQRPVEGSFYRRWAVRLVAQGRDLAGATAAAPAPGSGHVYIYNQDLANLADIPDASLEAIVSISALEHNTPEGLAKVVQEMLRVLKPGGRLLATLTAGQTQDWWHTPSAGWCYTAATLRRLFDLPPTTPDNYARYTELLEALRSCAELRDNLASFYYRGADKGMPAGVWEPQYQPVGVCKVKR